MFQHVSAQFVLDTRPMNLEDVEEQAKGGGHEIDDHYKGEGCASD